METCKGYMKERFENNEEGIATAIFETLYAVLASGEVLASEEINVTELPNVNFDRLGRAWSRVAELPAGVESIGDYQTPKMIDHKLDPRIGTLCREGRPVFYCYAPDPKEVGRWKVGKYHENENPTALDKVLADADISAEIIEIEERIESMKADDPDLVFYSNQIGELKAKLQGAP